MPADAPLAVSQDARLWGYLSYSSILTGVPLFLVPFVQRNDAFALHHAKRAAAAYVVAIVLAFGYRAVTLLTCGIGAVLFPIAMLPYVPAIHGFVLVANGDQAEPLGVFGL